MAITTWLNESERIRYSMVTDRDVNELLQEARKIKQIFLCEQNHNISRGFFRKPKTIKLYTMYIGIDGLEVQVFNWPSDGSWSINEFGNKAMVMSFFYGLLSQSSELQRQVLAWETAYRNLLIERKMMPENPFHFKP